jgi:acetylornithine aminotransferase
MATYGRYPISISRGLGVWVWDSQGRCYLDCVAGIATCSLGHSNPRLRRALNQQLGRIQHISNLYNIPEQEQLAHWITNNSCTDKVFFCNSGAEANEAAIKLARKYGHQRRQIERPLILSARSSFHGRTLAAVTATGQGKYHRGFEPLPDGFAYFTYNDIDSLRCAIADHADRAVAVLIEPLQGEGGVVPGNPEFFSQLRQLCDQHKLLLILDEVQVGMGRSGSLWGYEQLGIEADAITIAKGLGGGIPIGALAVKDACNVFEAGDHASTFGGNPFACRAALTVAAELERRQLLQNVRQRGDELRNGLAHRVAAWPQLLAGERGWGLIRGLLLRDGAAKAADLVSAAMAEGLLLVPAGPQVVRFLPPLVISRRELRQALHRLDLALERLT